MADDNEASRIEAGIDRLGESGFSVNPGLLPLDLVVRLVTEQRRREDGGELVLAGVGRGSAQVSKGGPRRAQSSWFDGQSVAEQQFLGFAESLRVAINRRLMLGLFEFEAQFLHYPPGGFYQRHVDALQGERGRVVSLIAYLNEDWTSEDGGALAVWAQGGEGEPLTEVLPMAGTVVLLLSEEIPHEARIASRDRRAIAGWFSVNGSMANRIDPAK